jgi:hypothetical protein
MDKDEELLNNLREEYTLVSSKKALLRDHGDIVKEYFNSNIVEYSSRLRTV